MASEMAKPEQDLGSFYECHEQIVQGFRSQMEGYLRVGVWLKRMRDLKLYKSAGYETLTGYLAEKLVGVGERQAFSYIEAVEKLPEKLLQRLQLMAKPIGLTRLNKIANDQFADVSEEDMDRLIGLTDEELERELTGMGYDRKKMGGRGPSDLRRAFIERKRYRDNSKQVILERERRKNVEGEREELVRSIRQKDEELKRLREIVMSDDKTRAYELQVESMAATINAYHTAEHRSAAQKVDHQSAVRRITELRYHIIRLLQEFRDGVHLPTLETAAWLTVTIRDIAADLQRTYDFIASDALKEFSETGAPVPLEDAGATLEMLNKSIVADLTRLAAERGEIRIVGKPEGKK